MAILSTILVRAKEGALGRGAVGVLAHPLDQVGEDWHHAMDEKSTKPKQINH